MSPTLSILEPRFGRTCGYGGYWDGRQCTGRSGWYHWGRWVLAGIVVFFAVFFVLCLCCVSRRRRKRGRKPMYGTGWMAPTGGKFGIHQNQNQNYGQEMNNQYGGGNWQQPQQGYNAQQYPQQPYGQQPYGQDYYGGGQYPPPQGYDQQYGQQSGISQPPPVYGRGEPGYGPPDGPPPGK